MLSAKELKKNKSIDKQNEDTNIDFKSKKTKGEIKQFPVINKETTEDEKLQQGKPLTDRQKKKLKKEKKKWLKPLLPKNKKEKVKQENELIQHEKEKNENKTNKHKKQRVIRRVTELIPIVDLTEENFIELKKDDFYSYMFMIQLDPGDLRNKNEDDIKRAVFQNQAHFKKMPGDEKWVSLKFPADTSIQRKYFENLLEKESNPAKIKGIEVKLNELELIEKTRNNIEYYVFIYAKNKEAMFERIAHCEGTLRSCYNTSRLSREKIYQVLFKFNNQNSKVLL